MFRSSFLALLIGFFSGVTGSAFSAETVICEGDRIVVVGDSITGQSAGQHGYVTLMREGLAKAHPDTKTTVIPLGGSGQTVDSWQSVEKKSRDAVTLLDVPGIDVKATLDGGAEVLVVMLGMNNALRPNVKNTPESLDQWAADYKALVDALKARAKPRVIAVATPTLCTEDESSEKNKLMDAMSRRLTELAAAEKWILLPVRESFREMFRLGRSYRSDFHFAQDYVHPNATGHLAIASEMLKGLGEPVAAEAISKERIPKLMGDAAGKGPTLSYSIKPVDSEISASPTFEVKFWASDQFPRSENLKAEVKLIAPTDWKVTPETINGSTGQFVITGPLNRLRNTFELSADLNGQKVIKEIMIPAAWLVGIGNAGNKGWINKDGFQYLPDEGVLSIDADLISGKGFQKTVEETGWTRKPVWKRYVSSVNYTGGNDPGSVDLAAVGWYEPYDVAYGIRWIYSEVDRTVPVEISSQIFAGENFLAVWTNGSEIWKSKERKGKAETGLKKGWNAMVFKSNHLSWQWQFDIRLLPTEKDDLSDLRFSITPP